MKIYLFCACLVYYFIRKSLVGNPAPDLGANVVLLASHEVFARVRQVHAADGVLVSDKEGLAVGGGGGGGAELAHNDGRSEGVECHG